MLSDRKFCACQQWFFNSLISLQVCVFRSSHNAAHILTGIELRNRIYDFAAVCDGPVRIVHCGVANEGDRKASNRPLVPYGGLSRVCHQIREEYRPLQRRAADLEIDWNDLPKFYATFCNSTSISAEAPCAKLQVVLQDTESFDAREQMTDLIDIFPLLRLQNLSPTFACSFMSPGDALHKTSPPSIWPSEESDLNELLYHSHPDWLEASRSGSIERIMVPRQDGLQNYDINIETTTKNRLRSIGGKDYVIERPKLSGRTYLARLGFRTPCLTYGFFELCVVDSDRC
jgi:hypothetical protein